MYRATTRNIEVTVTPRFMSDRSAPEKAQFFWAYTIEIANNGGETVQLKTRYWHITDAFGRVQEVRGAGVVGEEPVIPPGESFEYTSGVPLQTPSGIMAGTLRHGHRRRREFRYRYPRLLARLGPRLAHDQLEFRFGAS